MHTILIVDDHATVRAAVRQLFESALHSVIFGEAENGAEALVKARELHPDLIVLDLTMPVMDGFQAAQALRQICPAIPILMLTAHYMEGTRIAAQQVGIRAVFSKVGDLNLLLAHASALLESNGL